jgi:ring-1,2-phenylacetyl-CoA epoxidase subunit PaaD
MVNATDIYDVLKTIPDPEMPISITDLGLIEDVNVSNAHVQIQLLPTFIGCFALPVIAQEIKDKVAKLAGIDVVDVELINDPPWSVDRISDAGRASLAEHGISVPESGPICSSGSQSDPVELRTSAIPCPWCNSTETKLTSPFGPTRCKSIHFCDACRQPFERMKKV